MSKNPASPAPIFYACVPELPDGPPFEIAWAEAPSQNFAAASECFLVRPQAAWSPTLVCDPAALKAYGLQLADLREFGAPVRELAALMNKTLTGRELFSATTADDARIKRIFDAAKIAPEFVLRKSDAEQLIAELGRSRRLSPEALACAKREAEVTRLAGVRAEAKARYLATYWGIVAGQR